MTKFWVFFHSESQNLVLNFIFYDIFLSITKFKWKLLSKFLKNKEKEEVLKNGGGAKLFLYFISFQNVEIFLQFYNKWKILSSTLFSSFVFSVIVLKKMVEEQNFCFYIISIIIINIKKSFLFYFQIKQFFFHYKLKYFT